MSTQRNSTISWNKKSVTTAMTSRVLFTEEQAKAGKSLLMTIRGDGNWVDVKNKAGELVQQAANEGIVLRKKIFNLQANSEIALRNPANKAILGAAIAAEKAGKVQDAANAYNDFLNNVQVSFSVLDNQSVLPKLGNNVEISAKLMLVTTENGSLITIDPKTIRVMEPEAAKKTTFSLDEFFGSEESSVVTEGAATIPASELESLTA